LLSLRVRDVNIVEQTVKILTSKNGDARECAVTPVLAALLQQLIAARGQDELLFETQDIRYAWARVVKAAKVTGATFHDWRRTAARAKRAAGVDTSIILKMQGWKTDAMMRRYAIVDLDDQRAALSLVDEHAHETHTARKHDA
jgi:integrase